MSLCAIHNLLMPCAECESQRHHDKKELDVLAHQLDTVAANIGLGLKMGSTEMRFITKAARLIEALPSTERAPVLCCMPNESAIEGFCHYAETGKEWHRCWTHCEKQAPTDRAKQIETMLRDPAWGLGDVSHAQLAKEILRIVAAPSAMGERELLAELEVELHNATQAIEYGGAFYATPNGPLNGYMKRALAIIKKHLHGATDGGSAK